MIDTQIVFIEIQGLSYNYNDYLSHKEIYINGRRENPKYEGFKASIDGCESEYIYYNIWPEIKYSYKTKAIIITSNKSRFILPLGLLMHIFEDRITIQSLAIFTHLEPQISYEFYSVGEKYGRGDSTIVTKNNTLIKSFLVKDGCEMIDPKIYIMNQVAKFSQNASELDKLVEEYFEHINYLRAEEDRVEMEKYYSSREYNRPFLKDEYYNDQLDLDQQDPEFWDNI